MSPKPSIKVLVSGGILFIVPLLLVFLVYNHELDDSIQIERESIFFTESANQKWNRIDYHNYTQMAIDAQREGPGENGLPYYLSPELDAKKDYLYSVNGFNGLASDQIALDRSLPDIRHPACKKKKYLSKLPSVSIVITLYNEHWTTLLRNVYSAINRAPPGVIKEVILVDDGSTKEFLKNELDAYMAAHIPITKVIHRPKRTGLMHGRLAGAKNATGDVLLFLDSHVECNVNYLPPLLEPIALNYKTVVCPFIDVLNHDTFEYVAQDEGRRGSFDWNFLYKRLPLNPEDLENPAEPFPSPIMAGGLFAISRKFFWEIGGYDEELLIWGAEQYELSFKIWMCGGSMVDAPCSRIGHIYRKMSVFPDPGVGNFIGRNYRRVAEAWMDEYAELLYNRRPSDRGVDPGDLSIPRGVRKSLNCKTFRWFMENVAYDQIKYFPSKDPQPLGHGKIQSMANESLCIDTENKEALQSFGVKTCESSPHTSSTEQEFVFSRKMSLRPNGRTVCFDAISHSDGGQVILFDCHGGGGNQLWYYDPDSHQLISGDTEYCLDYDPTTLKVVLYQCSKVKATQQWKFEHSDVERIKKRMVPY